MANDDGSLFILKKTPTRFQLLSNARLLFLDVCYYLPPGYSYAKYLKTYGGPSCEGAKSHFPYEYVNSLDKLSEGLPAYEAFYSSLRRKNTLDEDDGEVRGRQRYAELQALWHREGMTSLRDLLVYYNNCDVVPFLTALEKQCELYKTSGLDMLKDAPSLPGLGLRYGMRGLEGVFHTFSPDQAELAQLLTTSIVGGPSLVFCRLAEAGQTTIRTPDYGTEALACQFVVGFDANSLYPFGMAKKMPVGPCLVRREPHFIVEDPVPSSSGPRHSQAALQWIDYEAKKHNYPRVQHAGNGPEVRLGQRHIPVDGYHGESGTVFQYYGCLFHGHDCRLATESGDAWLGTEASDRRQSTEEIEQYLEQTCGYTVVTIWECQWQALKRQDPEAAKQVAANPPITLEPSRLPVPGSDTASVLQAIKEGEIFGLALVDIHTPAHLRDKFRDLPPIFKTCEVSRDDVGEHMRAFCERTGSLARPRRMLISSYFAVKTLIPTPLLRWYLQQGLEVTRLYLLMQYQPQQCFQEVTEDAANKRRQAQLDPSQELAGESSKLLINSVYGKTCENKSRFREYRFIKGPAVRKALRSHRFRSLETLQQPRPGVIHSARAASEDDPESIMLAADLGTDGYGEAETASDETVYELGQAPRKIKQDLPTQIAVFVYAYAKLRMLQFRYELMESYFDHRYWAPMYMDTDSYYMALAGASLHECLREEKKLDFYQGYAEWFPREACDDHQEEFVTTHVHLGPRAWYPLRQCCAAQRLYDEKTPGLFKPEFIGTKMVALCSKTYHCIDENSASSGKKSKLSSKGLQKHTNADVLGYEAYRLVLDTTIPSGGTNTGICTGPGGHVYTYEQDRKALSYVYAKRHVLADGIHTEPLEL